MMAPTALAPRVTYDRIKTNSGISVGASAISAAVKSRPVVFRIYTQNGNIEENKPAMLVDTMA